MRNSAFALLKEVARNDLVVAATVNGCTLRLLASAAFEGQPPRVVWSDLLRVLGVRLFRRIRMTKTLRDRFPDKALPITINGRSELTIPLDWAAGAMAAEPGLPAGLEMELAAAAELAVSKAAEIVKLAQPALGSA